MVISLLALPYMWRGENLISPIRGMDNSRASNNFLCTSMGRASLGPLPG